MATTGSPGWNAVTPSPRSATVPARSRPGVIGSGVGIAPAGTPRRMWSSTGLNEVAATSTSTWPDPGNGRYTLATLTDSGLRKVEDSAPEHVERVRQLVFDPLDATQQRQLAAALARIAAPVREHLDGP